MYHSMNDQPATQDQDDDKAAQQQSQQQQQQQQQSQQQHQQELEQNKQSAADAFDALANEKPEELTPEELRLMADTMPGEGPGD
jgi:spore germination cell wall hydrolase CwlJ-like protein